MPRVLRSLMGLALICCVTAGTHAESLVTEGYVNAPIAEVWRVFTTAEGLKTTGVGQAEVDLRVGGSIRSREAAGGALGDPQTLVREILAFDPERMLALKVRQVPAGFAHAAAIGSTWTIIYFAPSGVDMTHVRIVGLGYRSDSDSQALRQWTAKADRDTLDTVAKRYWPKCKLCTTEGAGQAEQ